MNVLSLCHTADVLSHPYEKTLVPANIMSYVMLDEISQRSIYCPFLRGNNPGLVDFLHKGRVLRNVFPCHDVIIRI